MINHLLEDALISVLMETSVLNLQERMFAGGMVLRKNMKLAKITIVIFLTQATTPI
ncbi:hypothetical protein D3C81_1390710 [compost metagenome]